MAVDPRLDAWLTLLEDCSATALLLVDGSEPVLRSGSRMQRIEEAETLTSEEIEAIARAQIGDPYGDRLHLGEEVDFSFRWKRSHILASAFYQRRACSLLLRRIDSEIPSPAALRIPAAVAEAVLTGGGLLLVTGPAGSGRSTTLASLVDSINRRRSCHIVTIEDPIEYLHANQASVVTQREVGVDSGSFVRALRSAAREAADVVMVSELPDLEAAATALALAETGKLVLAALPAAGTVAALERLVDSFPPPRRTEVRVQLSCCLLGVLHQRLLPSRDAGMVAAHEVLLGTPAVRRLVRDGRTGRLRSVLASGSEEGTLALDTSLRALVVEGRLAPAVAAGASEHPDTFLDLDAIASAGSTPATVG